MGSAIFLDRSGNGRLNRPSTVRALKFRQAFTSAFGPARQVFGYQRHNTSENVKFAYVEWPSTPIFFTRKGFGSLLFCVDFFVFLYLRVRGYQLFIFYRDAYWAYNRNNGVIEHIKALLGPLELWWLNNVATKICVPSQEFADYLGLQKVLELPPACRDMPLPLAAQSAPFATSSLERCKLIYVGGVSRKFYDLSYLVAAVSYFDITICCRVEELIDMDDDIKALVDSTQVRLIHENIAQTPSLLCDYHIGFMCHPPSTFKSVAMPFKFFEYIDAGLPVIVDAYSPAAKIVQAANVGWVIDEKEDMTTSLQAIAEVAIDDKRRSCMVYRQANQWSNRLQLLVDEAKTA